MTDILQRTIPYDPLTPRKLPGIQPLAPTDWLIEDDAFAGQMAKRDGLLCDRREAVLAMDDSARPAAEELLDLVLSLSYPDAGETVVRSDSVAVAVDRSDPMGTIGRLVQEDFCILQKQGDEHVLTAAVLCFPASWSLYEKFMRPLIGIHETVDSYDANIAARVQRLFDGVQPSRPLWRFNAIWYADAELFQPRSVNDHRVHPDGPNADFLRSELQSVLRLPETRAVVFSIHTFVLARQDVVQP